MKGTIYNFVDEMGRLGSAERYNSEGGGAVTAAAVAQAISQFNASQADNARQDLGAAAIENVIIVAGTEASISPVSNTIYKCGELTSLTITDPPATGSYSIVFTSGATETDCDLPDSLQWQNDTVPTVNANKTYEIIVSDNRAVCGEFPVAAVSAS